MQVFLSGLRQGLSALTIKLIENIQNLAKDSSFSSDVQAGRHFYAGNNTIFATLCTGQIIAVDRRDLSLAPHLILKGYWERELSLRCEHLVKTLQAPVIFDVGCNFGWYGLILSRFSPYSQIHFFEANPALIELLQKTTIANGFSLRSKIINRAVSSRSGKFLELSVPALHKGSSSVSGFNHDLERFHENMLTIEKVSVESITLDDYCKENSVDSIHFLKIDVEGSEADVILGAQMIIRRSPSLFILMEWNRNRYSDEILPILKTFTLCDGFTKNGILINLSDVLRASSTVLEFESEVGRRLGLGDGDLFDLFFVKNPPTS